MEVAQNIWAVRLNKFKLWSQFLLSNKYFFQLVGQMVGGIQDLEVESSSEEEEEEDDDEIGSHNRKPVAAKSTGVFSMFK